jgi:hypothetical protein
MLEQTRRQASIFVYLIFGLLILIFIWGINPGNRGGREGGCSTTSNTVISVDGADANQSAFLIAYSANGASGRQKVYMALDSLVRRELLAQAAAERGIRTTGDLVDEEIKRGSFFLGGQRIDFSRQFFDEVDGEKFFNIKRFKGWVSSLNVSPGSYREEQARGMQAAMMAELLTGSVRVSRDEALANYLYENNTVTYDVVAFDPGKYRLAMRLGDPDIKRFLDGHTGEVEARYKADERTYKGVKPQLALREIFIPKAYPQAAPADDKAAKPADDKAAKPADDKAAKPADDKTKPADKKPPDDKAADKTKPADKKPPDDKAADKTKPADKKPAGDKKPAAGEPANPRGLLPDIAKAKLEAARNAIAAGKLKFTDAEKQLAADSSDDVPADNGDRGWRSVDNAGLGDKAVNDAVKTLKPGEMTPVIVTDRGAYLVIATDKREGDLSFDQVKTEIAAALAKDVWSKEAAKRDALETLAKAQAGGKTLDQLFERELVKPSGGGIEELLNDPSMTQEQKQQILQQLMQQQKHGSLEVHEQDVPVAWFADADGSGTGSSAGGGAPAAASAGGSAAAAAAPATGGSAAVPAVGSPAAGSAPTGATAGSGAPGAGIGSATAPATPAAPPAPTVVEASKDLLPQLGDVPKAKVNRLGPSPRQAKMPGVGGAKDAVDALFDDLAPGSVAKNVYEGDGGKFVVIQLINRSQPNVEDFDKTADAEIAQMQQARGKAALGQWLKGRCDTLSKVGKIKPAADRIRETDDKGNPAPTVYHPCMYFDYLDR